MTPYQKESRKATMLVKLSDVKLFLYSFIDESEKALVESWGKYPALNSKTLQIIDRNLTSIEKQIKKL